MKNSPAQKKMLREEAKSEWKNFLRRSDLIGILLGNLRDHIQKKINPDGRLLAYLPLPDEPDIMPLLKVLNQDVYLPRVFSETEMEFHLFLRAQKVVTEMSAGFAGIYGPKGDGNCLRTPLLSSDTVIVPTLAANSRGYRLGRGKGYYDRFLEKMGGAKKIAILPECLARLDFLEEDHDLGLDVIITEKGELIYSER